MLSNNSYKGIHNRWLIFYWYCISNSIAYIPIGAKWFLAKLQVLYHQAKIAVGQKFALYQTRYDLQVHWALCDKKLTWYNSGLMDGSGEVCVCFMEMPNKVKK